MGPVPASCARAQRGGNRAGERLPRSAAATRTPRRLLRAGRLAGLALALAAVAPGAAPLPALGLRLIGVQALPPGTRHAGAPVGGLSGLDYDAVADAWIAVSDDRVEHGPARIHTVQLDYDAHGFTAVRVTGTTLLRQPDGTLYPGRTDFAARGGDVPDFEAVRLDPRDGEIWYASEGDRGLGLHPFVRRAGRDGRYAGALALPPHFHFSAGEQSGPRPNLTIESLAFAPDGESLWLALEAPRIEDGPRPTRTAGGLTRLTRVSRAGMVLAQYAYPLDPWQLPPLPGAPADNGLSELLALPDGRLLALERSGTKDARGAWIFAARLYAVEVAGATDVAAVPALAGARFEPVRKTLGFDFARSGRARVDNLEGLAWGRRLANGHATLVAVSDDNFLPEQETQFWVFEVLSPP